MKWLWRGLRVKNKISKNMLILASEKKCYWTIFPILEHSAFLEYLEKKYEAWALENFARIRFMKVFLYFLSVTKFQKAILSKFFKLDCLAKSGNFWISDISNIYSTFYSYI